MHRSVTPRGLSRAKSRAGADTAAPRFRWEQWDRSCGRPRTSARLPTRGGSAQRRGRAKRRAALPAGRRESTALRARPAAPEAAGRRGPAPRSHAGSPSPREPPRAGAAPGEVPQRTPRRHRNLPGLSRAPPALLRAPRSPGTRPTATPAGPGPTAAPRSRKPARAALPRPRPEPHGPRSPPAASAPTAPRGLTASRPVPSRRRKFPGERTAREERRELPEKGRGSPAAPHDPLRPPAALSRPHPLPSRGGNGLFRAPPAAAPAPPGRCSRHRPPRRPAGR